MPQTEDVSGHSRIRCHRADVAEAAVEQDVEKVPDREALAFGIHSRREQAVEVGSQDLTLDYKVFQMVCHCSPADCNQSVCSRSHIHSHCRSRQRG